MRLAPLGGNHDNGHTFRVRHPWKLLDKFQAVHDWHVDVTKDQIDRVFLEDNECLSSVPGLEYLGQVQARLAQRAFHDLSHHRGIVDDQSTYGHKAVLSTQGKWLVSRLFHVS